LEYAYADFATALLAKALKKKKDYNYFINRVKNYTHLWDEKTQFFRAKTSKGKWADDESFNPSGILQKHYVEGNAWQYLFFVPYDVPKLIKLFGSKESLLKKLDAFFENSLSFPPKTIKSGKIKIVFPDQYYWHGNEPNIHSAYMYVIAGRPDKAPKWIRWILNTKYTDGPDGLNGNDDGGTLSAWYVFSAMGFYPLAGTDFYLLGSPIFEKIIIHFKDGDFTIIAKDTSSKNIYIQSAILNGKSLKTPWVKHSNIAKGGKLVLKMGEKPSSWGIGKPLKLF
jgi:predicted alpha-1,2-mannosidase